MSLEVVTWSRTLLSHSSGFAYDNLDHNLINWATAHGKEKEILSGEWVSGHAP